MLSNKTTLNPLTYCLLTISLLFFTTVTAEYTYAHSGGLNRSGCHNNRSSGQYHCHSGSTNGSSSSTISSPSLGEDYYNTLLSTHLGGETEVTIEFNYGIPGSNLRQSNVRIDIVTDQYAIEGGLDKRSSLDSIQQAVFAASQLGLRPAVAIYDTDGSWGKYEHRIWTAAKNLGVKYFWVRDGQVLEP